MATALQIALLLAAFSFIAIVACLLPIAFHAQRRLERLAVCAEQLKANVDLLVLDSRQMVSHVNALAERAYAQMGDAAQVVHTVKRWTEHADRLAGVVGPALELPVFAMARNANRLRRGATSFLRTLLQKETHHV